MNIAILRDLIVGVLIGGVIYWVATLIPEATFQKIVMFIGGLIILLVVVNFILALLGLAPLVKIG